MTTQQYLDSENFVGGKKRKFSEMSNNMTDEEINPFHFKMRDEMLERIKRRKIAMESRKMEEGKDELSLDRLGLKEADSFVKEVAWRSGNKSGMFRENEVIDMISARERIMKKNFDAILAKKLQEQFGELTQFISENIHRKINSTECSYLS